MKVHFSLKLSKNKGPPYVVTGRNSLSVRDRPGSTKTGPVIAKISTSFT